MLYKHTICHIDQPNIEYPEDLLSASQVKEMVLNYPWKENLKRLKALPKEETFYSPSLEFINQKNNFSLTFSAGGENPENFEFYLWYKRKVMRKMLFGLLGEKLKFHLTDKWFSIKDAHILLDKFLSEDYKYIESSM